MELVEVGEFEVFSIVAGTYLKSSALALPSVIASIPTARAILGRSALVEPCQIDGNGLIRRDQLVG